MFSLLALSATGRCNAPLYYRTLAHLQISLQTSERRYQGDTEHSFSNGVLFSHIQQASSEKLEPQEEGVYSDLNYGTF